MHRDLVKLLAPVSSLPHALPVKIPMKGGLFLQNIQLPHLQFHCMHKHYTDRFNSSFFPEAPHSLRSFWETFSQHICMRDHPALGRPDLYSKGLPIKIHGDAMPVTGIGKVWSKGMLVMNWSGLLSTAASRENCDVMYVAVWQHILAEMHYIYHISFNVFEATCIWLMYFYNIFVNLLDHIFAKYLKRNLCQATFWSASSTLFSEHFTNLTREAFLSGCYAICSISFCACSFLVPCNLRHLKSYFKMEHILHWMKCSQS